VQIIDIYQQWSDKDGKDFKMNVWFGIILVIITFASYVISLYAAEQALQIYQSGYTEEVIDFIVIKPKIPIRRKGPYTGALVQSNHCSMVSL